MFQYYFLNKTIPKSIDKLKNKLHHNKTNVKYIVSNEGVFYIENNETIYKYILSDNITPIQFNLLNHDIIQQDYALTKINKEVFSIPILHEKIDLIFHTFTYLVNSTFKIIFIERDNVFIDYYILSELENTDYNLKEDISYFIRMLM